MNLQEEFTGTLNKRSRGKAEKVRVVKKGHHFITFEDDD